MMDKKTAFLSYSHKDKDFAEKIATELRKDGIDVWLDKWEIKAGDSLIQKIFTEGLANCDIFLILLSDASIKSKWVKEELDSAIIRKIEDVTRIIPLIKEKCELPLPLRTLLWIDLSTEFDTGIRQLVKSIYDVSEKPALGKVPEYITELKNSVNGLSPAASTVGSVLLHRQNDQLGFEKRYTAEDIYRLVSSILSEDELNDAVDELEEYGLVRTTIVHMGTAPYDFGDLEPTYALFLHFKDEGLDYDPLEDIKMIASAVASQGEVKGEEIQKVCGLPPIRINRAVAYLDDYGIVRILNFHGSVPYNFGQVEATRRTRQFVEQNCKTMPKSE